MATPYTKIYNIFLGKVTDTDLPLFLDADKLEILQRYMDSSCKIFKVCKQDLKTRDEDDENFIEDLDDEVIEIITELMLSEWLKPKLFMSENFKNVMNTKDFNQFSPANLLKETRETYKEARKNAKLLMIDYSYRS